MFSLNTAWMRIGGRLGAGRRCAAWISQSTASRASTRGFWSMTASTVPATQQSPRVLGELVADEGDVAGTPGLLERAGDAPVAGADIVEPGETRIGGEQRPRLAIGALGIVADLAKLDDLELRIFLGEDMAEPHLALLMAAIAEAAGEQRDLAAARLHEAPEEMAREPAGGAVVDADIAEPRHVGDVADDGQHRHAAGDHLADRLAHRPDGRAAARRWRSRRP